MKSINTMLMMLLICITLTTNAQTDTKTYHDQMKVLMSQLDQTRFKNNTLYDKVYPLANLKSFNQNGSKDTSNYKHIVQAVHELHLAGDKQNIRSAYQLKQEASSAKLNNKVLVGIVNMDLSTFKEDAFDETDLKMAIDSSRQDKKMLEVVDKEPYRHFQSLVISPLQGTIKQETGSGVTFSFLGGMIQKSTNPIKTLHIDFGDGQNHPIIENRGFTNTTISHSFPTDGTYRLSFSGVYQDGSSFTTYAMIDISITPNDPEIKNIRATETFYPYIPDKEIQVDNYTPVDEMPEIDYKYYYSTKEPEIEKIMKPIIITDGIDYDDARRRNIKKIYNDELFIEETGEKLGNKLRALGYDVIIVDFPTYNIGTREVERCLLYDEVGNCIQSVTTTVPVPRQGGADYIQRNAQVLKELIRHVNDELVTNGSTEELVVVGPSMGGLVTRWALKEMEDAGEDHNTRLWVSFDAPQQGANASIGLQFGADYTDNVEHLNKLERSASREMLVFHVEDQSNHTVDGGAPLFRTPFKNDLAALGYPQNLRKVALVNGSSTGEINNAPDAVFVETHIVAISPTFGAFNFFNFIRLTKNSGTQKVFDLDQPWFFNTFGGSDGDDVFKYVVNDPQVGSLDTAPGSKFPLPLGTLDTISYEQKGSFFIAKTTTQLLENPNFMPTKFALDFTGANKKLSDPICYDLVATGETPFDSYYAPSHNEPHVQLNTANVAWILKEINGDEPPPVYGCCGMTEIIGDTVICYNETKTYQLNSPCAGEATWSVSHNLTMGTPTGNQIEVTSNGGAAWIKATFDNGDTIIKDIVGKPDYILEIDNEFPASITIRDDGLPVSLDDQNITNIIWQQTNENQSGAGTLDTFEGSYDAFAVGGDVMGWVRVYNDCGYAEQSFSVIENNQNNCENPDYIIESLGLDKYKLVDTCDPENIQYVDASELYDQYGVKIEDLNPQQDEVDMSNTSNSGDIRIIMFIKDGQVFTKLIIAD